VSLDSKTAGNMIQILSGLPDFLRKPMLKSRIKEFNLQSNLNKRETIVIALQAAASIPIEKLSILMKTWLEVVAESNSQNRTSIFHIYCEEILRQPSIVQKLDTKILTDVLISLDSKQKEKITDSLKEAILILPNKDKLLRLVPRYTLQALQLLNLQ